MKNVFPSLHGCGKSDEASPHIVSLQDICEGSIGFKERSPGLFGISGAIRAECFVLVTGARLPSTV